MYQIKECGKRVSSLRKKRQVTQDKLAIDICVSKETISRLERGARGLSIDLLCIIASYFEVSTDYLLFGSVNNRDMQKVKRLLTEALEEL